MCTVERAAGREPRPTQAGYKRGSGRPSRDPQRGEVRLEDRFLFLVLLPALAADRQDPAHRLHLVPPRLCLGEDVLDVVDDTAPPFVERLGALDQEPKFVGGQGGDLAHDLAAHMIDRPGPPVKWSMMATRISPPTMPA